MKDPENGSQAGHSENIAPTHRCASPIDENTPDGLCRAYVIGAGELLLSVKKLEERFPDQTGAFVLVFHALELGLKAYLAKHGLTKCELRDGYRHHLVKLYNEALKRGMNLGVADADNLLEVVNDWHGSPIRYDFTVLRELPMCAALVPLAESIIKAALAI